MCYRCHLENESGYRVDGEIFSHKKIWKVKGKMLKENGISRMKNCEGFLY